MRFRLAGVHVLLETSLPACVLTAKRKTKGAAGQTGN